jgi:hypothetical protein
MPVGSQSPHYVANFRVLFAHVDGVHCVWPSKVDSRLPVRNGRPVERFYLYNMIFIALLCLMARYWTTQIAGASSIWKLLRSHRPHNRFVNAIFRGFNTFYLVIVVALNGLMAATHKKQTCTVLCEITADK